MFEWVYDGAGLQINKYRKNRQFHLKKFRKIFFSSDTEFSNIQAVASVLKK
jgi:hypothetical protein